MKVRANFRPLVNTDSASPRGSQQRVTDLHRPEGWDERPAFHKRAS